MRRATRARRLKRTHGLDVLIVDYLQLVRPATAKDSRVNEVSEITQGLKAIAKDKLIWLDGLLGDKTFICGDRFTLADIMLYCFLTFGAAVGQPLPEDCTKVAAWLARVGARPSASA